MKTKKPTYDELEKQIEELEKEKKKLKKNYTDLCLYVKKFHHQDNQNFSSKPEKDISFYQTETFPFISMCSSCKKVRDSHNEWHTIEKFIQNIVEQEISHGLCPECAFVLYPEVFNNSFIENNARVS